MNISHHFFGRLVAAFLLVTALATLSIYLFFQQRASVILHDLVKEETVWFDRVTSGLDWEQEDHRIQFIEAFHELTRRRNFTQLLITSLEGEEIFYYSKNSNEEKLLPVLSLDSSAKGGEMRYRLVRRNSHYQLHFSVYPHTARGKAIVRGILPMEEGFARQIEGAELIAISVVLITASLIGAVTLPLVRRAYKKVEQRRYELQRSYLATTQALGRVIAKRDDETNRHNFRVAYYALKLGENLGLTRDTLRALTLGAFLHDLGKVATPDHILLKPGSLDKTEREVIENHVSHGMEIIADIEWLKQAEAVIGSHHERFDGSGYPSGLRGENIPVEARVFAVVDVFDALVSKRPYKSASSLDDALNHLATGKNAHFDPKIVETFLPIAADLYRKIANLGESHLQIILQQAAATHFPEQRFPDVAVKKSGS
ncbi:MAG: HD-GYP domain-containing protein [Thermodesulfobacteriota bacterium]